MAVNVLDARGAVIIGSERQTRWKSCWMSDGTELLQNDIMTGVPLPNSPRSPPFLAELQSLNWEARASNFSCPDLICSMYSVQKRDVKHIHRTSQNLFPLCAASLTLNEIQGLIFRSCDVLFSPGGWTTWLIMLHQEMRAAYLNFKKKEKIKHLFVSLMGKANLILN